MMIVPNMKYTTYVGLINLVQLYLCRLSMYLVIILRLVEETITKKKEIGITTHLDIITTTEVKNHFILNQENL